MYTWIHTRVLSKTYNQFGQIQLVSNTKADNYSIQVLPSTKVNSKQ